MRIGIYWPHDGFCSMNSTFTSVNKRHNNFHISTQGSKGIVRIIQRANCDEVTRPIYLPATAVRSECIPPSKLGGATAALLVLKVLQHGDGGQAHTLPRFFEPPLEVRH